MVLRFHPKNSDLLYAGTAEGIIHVYNVETGEEVLKLEGVYRVFLYLSTPPSNPDYHAHFQNYNAKDLLPVSWFMYKDRTHFHE